MNRVQRMLAALQKNEVLRSPLWPQQQCQIAYCPGLTARPFHDAREFPWLAALESQATQIRAELDALIAARAGFLKVSKERNAEVVDGTWSSFNLYVHGRPVTENVERCPITVRALEAIPDRVGLAGFMALAPDSHAHPHYGTTNLKLRVHLGLHVPEGATIRIATELRTWQDGKALVLDDSFQHEVWNTGASTRFILLADFLHPDLDEEEKNIVREFETSMQETAWRIYAPDDTAERWPAKR